MKKVLMITNHSYMFWQFRREVVSEIIARGNRVVLALPFGDRVEELQGLGCSMIDTPMERRGVSPLDELKLMRTYRRILQEEKPDIVVTYSIKPNIYAGLACKKLGIPYCINVQGMGTAFQTPGLSSLVTVLYRAVCRKARVVFFENHPNARMFREKRIMDEDRQVVLSGAGINLERYTPQPYPENDCTHFLFLGRVMREKGINELFSAVRRLHADGENFHLDLLGFYEESYADQVEDLTKLGICTFHGFQTDTRPWYGASNCVVLPSYHEGMSNVLLEAAAIGRPLITSDIPGCREAVDEGINGFTCPAKDADALYDTMKRFLTLSRAQREAMGQAGIVKMQAQFDKKQVVEKTLAAIFRETDHETVR